MKRALKTSLCFVLCGALLSGCSKNDTSVPDEISVSSGEDTSAAAPFPASSCGVVLEKAVEKAVSLSPAATEIICELGYKGALVGVSDYCDYPADISAKKVGSTENPNLDEILSLKPDAVFTLSPLSEREIYMLKQAGIVVLTAVPPTNMEGYSDLYKEIAAAFVGREKLESEKETEKAVQIGSKARLEIENAAKSVKLESFVYVTSKLTVAGSDTFESAVLSLSGENACKEKGYVSADKSGVQPKYIIADSALSADDLAGDDTIGGYIGGGAEVRFINSAAFERPSARTADVFKELS